MKLIAISSLFASSLALFQELNFSEWKQVHQISFPSLHEDRARLNHFLRAKEFVKSHNKRFSQGLETHTVTLNKFAAMPEEEFAEKYLQNSWDSGTYGQDPDMVSQYSCPESYKSSGGVPSSYASPDVTGVKDQGSCGSCWSFGAGAAIEGALCKAGKFNCKNWNGVSTQQMVDCASSNSALNPYGNNGCNGGFQSNALRYVFDYEKGIESWDDYSYKGVQGTCNYKSSKSVGTIKSCGRLGKAKDEDVMISMIYNKGVTTVAIDASGIAFQLYDGGVYSSTSCSTSRLNHAVTATGYGKTDGTNTLTIKNSWGKSWGASGYVYFARTGKNTCGVFSEGQYAIYWVE